LEDLDNGLENMKPKYIVENLPEAIHREGLPPPLLQPVLPEDLPRKFITDDQYGLQ